MAMPEKDLVAQALAAMGARMARLMWASQLDTQRKVAVYLGTSEATVSRWKRGGGLDGPTLNYIAERFAGVGIIVNDVDRIIVYLLRGGPEPFELGLVGDGDEATTERNADILYLGHRPFEQGFRDLAAVNE